MDTHSSILAWRIPWTEEPGRLQSIALQRIRHGWVTNTFTCLHTLWRYFLTTILTHRQLCPAQPGLEAGLLRLSSTTPLQLMCSAHQLPHLGASNLSTLYIYCHRQVACFLQDELFYPVCQLGLRTKQGLSSWKKSLLMMCPRQRLQKVRE